MKLPSFFSWLWCQYCKRTPQHRGKFRLSQIVGGICEPAIMPVPRHPELRMRVHVNDTMSLMSIGEDMLDETLWSGLRQVPAGGVVVDIGANIGVFSCIAASKVTSAGLILSFEPNLWAYSELLKNIALNGLRQVVPVNAAISSEAGVTKFRCYPGGSGLGHISTEKEPGSSEVSVAMFDGATIAKLLNGRRIDLLKIDVEGAEVLVVRGLRDVLDHVNSVALEVWQGAMDRFHTQAKEAYDLLAEHGLRPTVGLNQNRIYNEFFVRGSETP